MNNPQAAVPDKIASHHAGKQDEPPARAGTVPANEAGFGKGDRVYDKLYSIQGGLTLGWATHHSHTLLKYIPEIHY